MCSFPSPMAPSAREILPLGPSCGGRIIHEYPRTRDGVSFLHHSHSPARRYFGFVHSCLDEFISFTAIPPTNPLGQSATTFSPEPTPALIITSSSRVVETVTARRSTRPFWTTSTTSWPSCC